MITRGGIYWTDLGESTGSRLATRRPVLVASTSAGEKAFCDTKVTKRGEIRVNTKGYEAVRVTVIVRATPKPGHAGTWKPNTWRKSWLLR